MPDSTPTVSAASLPISDPAARPEPTSGTALCLSGGGYRAMLFHAGALIRLNETGLLRTLDRVSSVSGGSITAAVLALAWPDLDFGSDGVARAFTDRVIAPLRAMAGRSIDKRSVLTGVLLPGRTVAETVAKAYDRHLFHGATLRSLPEDGAGPRFVINATNVQTGKLFRFSRPYAGDWTVGLWRDPTTTLADAVAASSAFPPVLSPHRITPSGRFEAVPGGVNLAAAFRESVWLSDGGVYDNLGLQTAWYRCRRLLVSDGGGKFDAEPAPGRDWARHGIRVLEIVDSQVRALRKIQLIAAYQRDLRDGAYWGLRTDPADYRLADPVAIAAADVQRARTVPTGLSHLDEPTQRALINWGYAITDTALRSRVDPTLAEPSRLPIS
ncbi:patatin-like phospholipase family protein [Actinoplanes sp. NPDC048791]|uniref:patatin-like phospholipase family protein n=1 Tax=Actinoplanes sp. NPDC048791 TaxID=3154623 RepID=UPI00340BAB32